MSEPSRSVGWRTEIEAWYALLFRIALGIAGIVVFVNESFSGFNRPILLALAAGAMGPVVAASVSQVIQSIRGGQRE